MMCKYKHLRFDQETFIDYFRWFTTYIHIDEDIFKQVRQPMTILLILDFVNELVNLRSDIVRCTIQISNFLGQIIPHFHLGGALSRISKLEHSQTPD